MSDKSGSGSWVFTVVAFLIGSSLVGLIAMKSFHLSERSKVAVTVEQSQSSERIVVAARSEVQTITTLPDFSLVDQYGKAFNRQSLQGKIWVAGFIFTSCKTMCPMLMHKQKRIMAKLAETYDMSGIGALSISVDPEKDSPEVLGAYRERNQISASSWSFLTGTRQAVFDLCRDGFKLPVVADPSNKEMPILHSDKFALIDGEGAIRGYYESESEVDTQQIVKNVGTLLREKSVAQRDASQKTVQ